MRNFKLGLALCFTILASPSAFALESAISKLPDEMHTAIDEAQQTVDQFLRRAIRSNGRTRPNASVMIHIEDSDGVAHVLWLTHFEVRDGQLYGHLAGLDNPLPGLREGLRVAFDQSEIVDWSLFINGVLFGNFTTRARFHELKPNTQDMMDRILSPTPVPTHW